MARVISNHTAPLGLPGVAAALGGLELKPGDNDVSDAAWAAVAQNPTVQTWLGCGLIVGPSAPVDADALSTDDADESPKKRSKSKAKAEPSAPVAPSVASPTVPVELPADTTKPEDPTP